MRFIIKIFFLMQACILFAQQGSEIKIQTPDGEKPLPVYLREGTIYIPVLALADRLLINTDPKEKDAESVKLSGSEYDIIIKAKNPFYVITNKNGIAERVFQVPTSTYSIAGDIYIPFKNSVDILNEILDLNLIYNERRRLITSYVENPKSPAETLPEKKYEISDLTIEEKANGTLLKISANKDIRFYNTSFSDGVLTIILRGVNTDPELGEKTIPAGLIKGIYIINSGSDSEIKLTMGSDYSASEIIKAEAGNNLLVTLHNKVFSKDNDKLKEKWDFDVIVIDPGHGGKDAGAVGINGVKEKDINLALSLKLGKLIEEKMSGVKVKYTRDKDKFVELYNRGKIANENNGKLFISVHCNSTADRSSTASGFEVYLLRPGRTQEAINIAERENSVIKYEDDPKRYQHLTDENFILVSMAHSAYMKYSEKFSEYMDKHFTNSFYLPNRGVKQAGFYVLVGASMPGVLVEAGFLSNKKDAAYLISEKGQEQTAELIFQSIKSFKNYYESFLGAE